MCRAVTCKKCGKPSWKGCGAHVEQVLGDVPRDQRCQCRGATVTQRQAQVLVLPMSAAPKGQTKHVVIVGGVAGGMSTATRLRRLDADVGITVIERSGHVSFANCGLPYFVGGLIEEEEDLTLQTPEQLFDRFRLDVRVNDEVVAIDRDGHCVTTRSMSTGEERVVPYDKLVLSMGAAPVRPPIPGYDRVRTLRTVEDAARLASDVDVAPTTAVIIGAGFIGLEMAENLVAQGIDVTIVEATPQVLPSLDSELAILVSDELTAHGVHVETGATLASVEERTVTLADGRVLSADLVVGAIGVRPDVRLAELAGPGPGAQRGDRGQRGEPDERSRCLCRWRCRREARCHLACDIAHRTGQCGQSPGSSGGGPHCRKAIAPRCFSWDCDRQGV